MANLIKILAASFGGGLVLGAGIRLGEALASRETDATRNNAGHLGDLEARMTTRLEEQAAEVSAIRSKLAAEARQIEALGEMGAQLHKELPDWIEKSVARRVGEAEANLKAENERNQKEALEAFVDGIQTRVAHRISRLEEEVSMHTAAMTELRACSLRTEAGIDKLAGGLDRLLAAQTAVPVPAAASAIASDAAQRDPAAAPAERPARSRRWGIFS